MTGRVPSEPGAIACGDGAQEVSAHLGNAPSRGDFIALMDDHKALQILVQSGDHRANNILVRGDEIFIRRDRVLSALQNTAAWVAEGLVGFQGVYPSRGLVRALDAGTATKAEQLMAAMSLRLMNQPEPSFSGLRITIEAGVDGQVHLHTQGFNMMGWDTQRVLDAALDSLTREIDEFRRCPFHRPSDSDGPRMAETNADSARGEAGPARAEGIANPKPQRLEGKDAGAANRGADANATGTDHGGAGQ